MNANIKMVAYLSKIIAWNKHSQRAEQMYNGNEDVKNNFISVKSTRFFNVIKKFPEFKHNVVKVLPLFFSWVQYPVNCETYLMNYKHMWTKL